VRGRFAYTFPVADARLGGVYSAALEQYSKDAVGLRQLIFVQIDFKTVAAKPKEPPLGAGRDAAIDRIMGLAGVLIETLERDHLRGALT
jgi:hypothetical protein